MSLDVRAIYNAVQSNALTLGYFESVRSHEAINPPGNGLHVDIMATSVAPSAGSGLAAEAIIITLLVRVRCAADQEPRDDIDPNLMTATTALIAQYAGSFSLGSNARNIDLFGQESRGVVATAGYINMSNKLYRVMDITLPIIINDAWTES